MLWDEKKSPPSQFLVCTGCLMVRVRLVVIYERIGKEIWDTLYINTYMLALMVMWSIQGITAEYYGISCRFIFLRLLSNSCLMTITTFVKIKNSSTIPSTSILVGIEFLFCPLPSVHPSDDCLPVVFYNSIFI